MKYLGLLLSFALISSVRAQIAPLSARQARAANRQALREASRTESPYKESHLTVTPQQLKRGSSEGPPGVANAAQLRPDGSPRKRMKLTRRRSAQTEPAP